MTNPIKFKIFLKQYRSPVFGSGLKYIYPQYDELMQWISDNTKGVEVTYEKENLLTNTFHTIGYTIGEPTDSKFYEEIEKVFLTFTDENLAIMFKMLFADLIEE